MLHNKLIDPFDPQYDAFLKDLQGNILKSHGRDYMSLVLLRFRPERINAVRTWMTHAGSSVSSALGLAKEARDYRENRTLGKTFFSLLLTARGCLELGWLDRVPRPAGTDQPRTSRPDISDDNDYFTMGMRRMRVVLDDISKERPADPWESPYRDSEIHAMLLVAADLRGEVENACQRALTWPGAEGLEWLGCEHGRRRVNPHKQDVEPFGYVDGISQPKFYASDLATECATGGGARVWDPAFPLGQVVVRTEEARETYGSFCVFRKLEQDAVGFHASMEALANTLELQGADRQRAAAMIIGRFPDGTPLQLQKLPGMAHPPTNDFDYSSTSEVSEQGDGSRCPFHAHIRKANPRHEDERAVVLARRGMPYGNTPLAEGETEGLLFLAYMADIQRQFGTLQINWMQDRTFPRDEFTGSDPLLMPAKDPGQAFPLAWGKGDTPAKDFKRVRNLKSHVTPRGGEYFFVPPRSWLLEATKVE